MWGSVLHELGKRMADTFERVHRAAETSGQENVMDVLNLVFDHFIEVLIVLFLFGGSLGAWLRWFVRHVCEHRERMQEKRNEELRLSIRLEQERRAGSLPRDICWEEQIQMSYEQGYQQQ
jgi:hypothetical protein